MTKKIPDGSNERIEQIIEDYPKFVKICPKGSFEQQLRQQLIKHKVK